jgi:hypothetical protein
MDFEENWEAAWKDLIESLEGPEREEQVDISAGLVPTSNAGMVPKTALSGGLIRKRHENELINRILHRHAAQQGKEEESGCAGINRRGVVDARATQERSSEPS